MNDRTRQAAVIVAALLQVLSPAWAYLTGIGQPIWTRSDAVTTAATPATYTFGIWSFIFLTSLGYGIFSVMPGRRADPILRRIGWWSALAFILNAAWGVVQQTYGVTWVTAVLIIAITIAAVRAFSPVANSASSSRLHTLLVTLPLGVLAGWITSATPVNIDQAFATAHVQLPFNETTTAILTLLMSAGLVAALLRPLRAHPAFVGAAVWPISGIATANVTRTPHLTVAVAAVLIATVLMASAFVVRKRWVRTG